jgi:hypothetical protein
MSERIKRDIGINRAKNNPSNNYDLILHNARPWVTRQAPGTRIVAGQVYRFVVEKNPNLKPHERRVMGAVMRELSKEKLIAKAGISTRERSHHGMATEWRRLS